METCSRLAVELPLSPGLAEIQAGSKTEFADAENVFVSPALRQTIASEKDVAAFEAAIGLAIKMVAKGLGIGHIAVAPFERRSGGVLFRICVCHGKRR